MRVYRNVFTDLLDTAMNYNILFFTAFTLFNQGSPMSTAQEAVAHISTLIALILATHCSFTVSPAKFNKEENGLNC